MNNLIYKNIKNFIEVDNHFITGNFTKIERLHSEKAVLIKFYDEKLQQKYRKYFLPSFQKYFLIKDYIREEYISSNKNDFSSLNNHFYIKHLFSEHSLDYSLSESFWNNSKYICQFNLNKLLKTYRRTFRRIEQEYQFKFLNNRKKKFLNVILKKYLYNFWFGNLKTRHLIKNYIKTHLLSALQILFYNENSLKKQHFSLNLGLSFSKKNKLFFKIPGLNEIFNIKFKKIYFKIKKNFHYKIKSILKKSFINIKHLLFKIDSIQLINKHRFIIKLKFLKK